jgi:CheY-like chemotaxis protein
MPAKILIVENDLDFLAIWHHVQETDDAILALSGSISAQKHLKKIDYDVDAAIIDLALEDGDGVTLTETIRRNESIRSIQKPCLIFWFTGYPMSETLEKWKDELGVTEIFTKPMDPISLINQVKGYMVVGKVKQEPA